MGSDAADDLRTLLDDLAAEQLVVDDAVDALDVAAWDAPTPAPGWSIRHQISHLTTFDEQGALAAIDPSAFEAGRDAALADRANFDTAGPYVALEPGALLARWRAGRAALTDAFAPLDPKARLPWYGPPMSARSFLTARLMEAWAHGVDVTDALGRPPAASERLRHVAHLGVVTRGWSYAVRGQEPPAAGVHVVLVSPAGDTWTWGDPALDDRIDGPALDFCLAVTQRRPLGELGLVPTGDAAHDWLEVAQAFAGRGHHHDPRLMLRRHDDVPASALAIAAHPDDAEFGAGATLACWAGAGCVVHHLVLTDGSKGTWDLDADVAALVATRRDEQRAAARALGATGEVRFLDRIDGELEADRTTRDDVARVIRELRPAVVLGHDPWRRYRLHPDHRAAGFLTTDGIVAAREPHARLAGGDGADLAAWRPSALLLWEADEPDVAVDVTGFTEPKLSALMAHTSQHESTMAISGDEQAAADETARFRRRVLDKLATWGTEVGAAHAEAFRLLDLR